MVAAHEVDGVPDRQRAWASSAMALALGMAFLDGTIANVGLPTIAQNLRVPPGDSVWVVSAYQLAVTISILTFASLGEIFGFRRIFLCGVAIFTTASAICSISLSLPMLVAARTLQGIGAAGILSVSLALVHEVYPRRLVGQGLGIIATVGPVAAVTGPTVAAAILAITSWPWLFAVNVPLGVFSFAVAWYSLPKGRRTDRSFDVISAALSVVTVGVFMAGLNSVGGGGGQWAGLAGLVMSLGSGFWLVRRQLTKPAPLLPVDLFRIPTFTLSAASLFCAFMAQGLAFVSLPFYFREVFGESQIATGLLMTPWGLAAGICAPVAGRAADRHSPAVLAAVGLAILAVGLGLLATLPTRTGGGNIAWRMAVCGIGFGCFNAPNNRMMMVSTPQARSGGTSGMVVMSRVLGQSMGATLVALIFASLSINGTTTALFTASASAAAGALLGSAHFIWQPRGTPVDLSQTTRISRP
jgi:DHA2 family multidrug resistance protein-like MFS transporter